jgi:predicted transcriptional regulator
MEPRQELEALVEEQATYPARRGAAVARARAAGMTWREIAEILGITEKGVTKAQRAWESEHAGE